MRQLLPCAVLLLVVLNACSHDDSHSAASPSADLPKSNSPPKISADAGAAGDTLSGLVQISKPSSDAEIVDLGDLLAEFRSDREAAQEKYDDKRMVISGIVADFHVNLEVYGGPMVDVEISAEPLGILLNAPLGKSIGANIPLKSPYPWSFCRRGDEVTIEGTFSSAGDYQLWDAKLISTSGQPVPQKTPSMLAEEFQEGYEVLENRYRNRWITLTGKIIEYQESEEHMVLHSSKNLTIDVRFPEFLGTRRFEVGDEITVAGVVDVSRSTPDDPGGRILLFCPFVYPVD